MPEIPPPGAAAAPAQVADDLDKPLDPQSVTVSRIAGGFWVLVLAAPFVIFVTVYLFLSPLDAGTMVWVGAGVLFYLALASWSFFWPPLRYRHASYRVAERGLWIKRGVVFRSEISVPKSRVQHTDVSQGPLQRRFDLATLVLHTAGTQHAAVSLGGLSHTAALAIRDHLIEGGPDDAV